MIVFKNIKIDFGLFTFNFLSYLFILNGTRNPHFLLTSVSAQQASLPGRGFSTNSVVMKKVPTAKTAVFSV